MHASDPPIRPEKFFRDRWDVHTARYVRYLEQKVENLEKRIEVLNERQLRYMDQKSDEER
jgi:hypothetical protein